MPLTREKLEALLEWLDPSDRESAGQQYKNIQSGLIRIFTSNGFSDAEHLADQTIDRVADLLPEIVWGYKGRPANYFHGVARNVLHEARRRKEVATDTLPDVPFMTPEVSDECECLRRCLQFCGREKSEMVLDYHVYQGAAKIANHTIMARELRITESALRVRAHRARNSLEKCVNECVEKLRGKRKGS